MCCLTCNLNLFSIFLSVIVVSVTCVIKLLHLVNKICFRKYYFLNFMIARTKHILYNVWYYFWWSQIFEVWRFMTWRYHLHNFDWEPYIVGNLKPLWHPNPKKGGFWNLEKNIAWTLSSVGWSIWISSSLIFHVFFYYFLDWHQRGPIRLVPLVIIGWLVCW